MCNFPMFPLLPPLVDQLFHISARYYNRNFAHFEKNSKSVCLKTRIIQSILHPTFMISFKIFFAQPSGPFTYKHIGIKMLCFFKSIENMLTLPESL